MYCLYAGLGGAGKGKGLQPRLHTSSAQGPPLPTLSVLHQIKNSLTIIPVIYEGRYSFCVCSAIQTLETLIFGNGFLSEDLQVVLLLFLFFFFCPPTACSRGKVAFLTLALSPSFLLPEVCTVSLLCIFHSALTFLFAPFFQQMLFPADSTILGVLVCSYRNFGGSSHP